jgi:hypothetical protein
MERPEQWRTGWDVANHEATPGSIPVTAAGLFYPATQDFEPQFAGKSLIATVTLDAVG